VERASLRDCVRGFNPQQLVKGRLFALLVATPSGLTGQRLKVLPCERSKGKRACLILCCVTRTHPFACAGMYIEFLHDWLRHFPRDQLLFLRNEDYAAATREHMESVFTFLGMRQPTSREWSVIGAMDRRNQQRKSEMFAETRNMLEEFFAPFNSRLAEALGDARFRWK